MLTPERLRAVYGVSVAVERLSQGQTVCAPDDVTFASPSQTGTHECPLTLKIKYANL